MRVPDPSGPAISPDRPPPPPPPPPLSDGLDDPASPLPDDAVADDEPPTLDRPRRRIAPEPPPETSFADRYKGTPWGAEPDLPAEAERPAPHRWRKWRPTPHQLFWAGAALVAIAATAGFVMLAGSLAPTGITAFTAMTPAPTAAATAGAPPPPAPPPPAPPPQPPRGPRPRH